MSELIYYRRCAICDTMFMGYSWERLCLRCFHLVYAPKLLSQTKPNEL